MGKSPLSKVHRLRQSNEIWECSTRRMRSWITPENQDPYRPHIVIVVSQTGHVVGTDIAEDAPSPDQVLSFIAKAMYRPAMGAGRKRRPAAIHIDDRNLAEALRPHLEEVSIRCEYRRPLRELQEVLLSLEQHMTRQEPIPALMKSAGVTPYLVNGLFKAAAAFYQEAPWRWIDDSHPIEVHYPLNGRPRYAVVMGHGGQTYGLAVYNSPDDLRELYEGAPPGESLRQQGWISLLYIEMLEMPFDDLDDLEQFGWPVAGPLAYPFPIRVTPTGQIARPGKSELLWFEAALLAIPTFVSDYMQAEIDEGFIRPAETTLSVTMADGEDRIHLRYPIPDFETPTERGWVAIIEEEETLAEAALECNAELLRAFEQWLVTAGLSKSTITRHLDNVAFFANVYMAGDGGCVKLPRPADQADTVDVDEFFADWFIREAAWVSEGTVKASLASLKKFFTCLKKTGLVKIREADEILEMLQENRDFYIQTAQDHQTQTLWK